MDYLRLIMGLLLPWAGGYFWLIAAENRFNPAGNPNNLRQIGYGLFLGFAGLQGIVLISAALMGRVEFWSVLAIVSFITAAGAGFAKRTSSHKSSVSATPVEQGDNNPIATMLFWLLIIWAVLHLALAAIEVFNRPVFPTDALLVWVYRAKAWFYSGNVYQLASPAAWLDGTATVPYAAIAYSYPTFASIIPFWAALSLGHWSETLINTPVLLCGIALGLALYGQSRELGVNRLLSVGAVYLLLSVPLVGSHLSLAGYADVWMLGFAGLGFVALVHGQAVHNHFQAALGLGMIFLSIMVKDEGVVWLCTALAMLFLVRFRLRGAMVLLMLTALLIIVAMILDCTFVDLPLVGRLGVANGKVYIPFLGSHTLQINNVWAAYWDSFFTLASWHLLWPMLVLAVGLLFFLRSTRLAVVIAVFLLIATISQVFIFVVTELGVWASDFSSINRLPLQLVPALLYCLVVLFSTLFERFNSRVKRGASIWVYLLPAITSFAPVVLGLVAYLAYSNPSSHTHPVVFGPEKLAVVAGAGQVQDSTLTISRYDDGYAIVSSGLISHDADLFPILRYDVGAGAGQSVDFMWRRALDPNDVRFASLDPSGAGSIYLADEPEWSGQITEIGYAVFETQDAPAQIKRLMLEPPGLVAQLRLIWSYWTAPEPWTQASVNWLNGGRVNPFVSIPFLLAIWLVSTLVLYGLGYLLHRDAKASLVGFGACVLFAWILVDLRWTENQKVQAMSTIRFAQEKGGQHCIDDSGSCDIVDLIRSIKPQLRGMKNNARVVIVPNKIDAPFLSVLAKYLLLPKASVVYNEELYSVPNHSNNYMLMLKSKFQDSGDLRSVAAQIAARKGQDGVKHIWESELGALFKVNAAEM
jgi:hypothetical protein